MPDSAASRLTLRLFGTFEARVGETPLPRLRTRKGQWLLALLAIRPGAEVERAWLAGVLWPDSSEAAALGNLRSVLMDLRHALGAEAGRLHCPTTRTLCLDLAGAEVDLREFDAAIARGDAASLQQAIDCYRGPLLEDSGEEWVFQERQSREQAYLEALEALAARALEESDSIAVERYLRRAVAVDPLRESAQRALMQLLAAGRNYVAASMVYRELRQRLRREINAAPDAETTALYQQLRDEARLRAQAPRPVPASVPLSPPLPAGETLTFLFTDIEGSVRLWEEQPEAMSAALARHDTLLRQAIEAAGGVVFKRVGDAICAVFATASAALAAALAGQRSLQTEPDVGRLLQVRMALHTGAAEQREGDYFGPPLNRVTRLLETGHGGQVLLSQPAYELVRDHLPEGVSVRDLGEHRLQDLVRPERVFQLVASNLPCDFPPLRTLETFRHNLPVQLTSFIGREQEMAAIGALLRREDARLVTLTGPGGTGKTRLALQAATELLDEFPDGVFFVDLAPISDPQLVASTIAQTLGLRETAGTPLLETLKAYLREKQFLLLLDNLEQVIQAAPLVSDLLATAPRLKMLVTSRAVLHLRGEREFSVPPLSLPDQKRLPALEALSQYAAVALFIQRAQEVKPEFAITNENAPAVAEICHRLDGLPLAIELAAARIKLLPPPALLGHLDSRLKLLTGGARDLPARQQTLRSTIAWSYDLLDEKCRRLFQQLAVFAGGWTLEAAEAICNLEGDIGILDEMTLLVDNSLIQRAEPSGTGKALKGEPRFIMLETIREYALERLEANHALAALRRRHAQYFLGWVEQAEPHFWGASIAWFDRFEAEHANLRAVLAWAMGGGELETGVRLAGLLSRFWRWGGHWTEGRAWLQELLALTEGQKSTPARGKAFYGAGHLARWQGDLDTARRLLEESVAIWRQLGDAETAALALLELGRVAGRRGDREQAAARYEESLELSRAVGYVRGMATALLDMGDLAHERCDWEETRSLYEQSLETFREGGDLWGVTAALNCLGHLALGQHRWAEARAHFEEERRILERLPDNAPGIAGTLQGLGLTAHGQGNLAAARQFLEESFKMRTDLNDKVGVAWCLSGLGQVALDAGDLPKAHSLNAEGLLIHWGLRDQHEVADHLRDLAKVACAEGQLERSARLLGAAHRFREAAARSSGQDACSADAAAPDAADAEMCAALNRETFTIAWAEGRAMTLEQAVMYALEVDEES